MASGSAKYHVVVSSNNNSITPFTQQFDLDDAISMPESNLVARHQTGNNYVIPFTQQFDLDDAISLPESNLVARLQTGNNYVIPFTQQFDLDDALSIPPENLLARHQTVTRLVSNMPSVNHAAGNCSICMESFWQSEGSSTASREVSCGHVYHHNCITDWLLNGNSNSCPLCRHQISR
ncbi:hypothetical protein REPUB_Repub18cG0099100 [Reevesia pubescens]